MLCFGMFRDVPECSVFLDLSTTNNTKPSRVKDQSIKARRGCEMRTTRTILKSIDGFSANYLLLAFTKCLKITNMLNTIL